MMIAALRGRGPLARLALRSRALAQPAALRSRALATAVRQKPGPTPEKAGPSRPTPEKAGPLRKFHPKAVTGMLMQAKDLEALLSICDRQRALEPIHVSAFWISLCRLEPRGVAASVLDGEALRALRLATLNQLPHMNPWSLANVCYALAQLRVGADRPAWDGIWELAAQVLAEKADELAPQGISNVAWAFVSQELHAPATFERLAASALRRLEEPASRDDFTAQALATVAWAFASFHTPSHGTAAERRERSLLSFPAPLFDALRDRAVALLREAEGADAKRREELREAAHVFNMQDLAQVAWAFAVVGRADASLFELVERAALPQLEVALQPGARERTGARQNISNLAWAFAAADVGGDTLFGGASPFVPRVVASLALDDESARESQLHRSQLHVWNLWREERGAGWPGLPPEFAADCLESFGVDGPDRESLFQAEVRQTLEALLEAPLEEEVRTPQGMLLDLVATIGGVKVSFEVDGPSHFIDGRTPNGYTLLKRRLLRSQGFALVSIPYWEWDGLGDHEGFRGRPSEETWTKRAEVVTQKLIELEAELRARRAEEKSK